MATMTNSENKLCLTERERLTYNGPEAAAAIGVSLPVFYELARRSDFPAIRIGRKIVVPKDGLHSWLEKSSGSEVQL